MFLPDDVDRLFNQFSKAVFEPKYLDEKTIQLVAVACSVMADCIPCIESHYKKAAAAGVKQEEIAEALAVALAISAGSKRAKYKPLINNLELNA